MADEWMHVMDDEGETPVTRAVLCSDMAILQMLNMLTHEKDGIGHPGREEFWRCIRDSNVRRVRELIEEGISPQEEDENGLSPLHYAALTGCLDMAKLLVNRGADVNAALPEFGGLTPFMLARKMGYRDVDTHLAEHGGTT